MFENPFTFRVDRDPNPHVAFGIGEHYCLGANLARKYREGNAWITQEEIEREALKREEDPASRERLAKIEKSLQQGR